MRDKYEVAILVAAILIGLIYVALMGALLVFEVTLIVSGSQSNNVSLTIVGLCMVALCGWIVVKS